MYIIINKLSVTKIEAADRVNVLQSNSCSFEQYKFSKLGQMLIPCLDMPHFMIVTRKTLAFRHRNQTLDNFIKLRSILKQLCVWLVEVGDAKKQLSVS